MAKQKLKREFYTRLNVLTISRELLGKLLVVPDEHGNRVSGKIVEVEAYRGPEDRASHAYGGRRTKRTETMYQLGGMSYVYFVYGMYHQFNVVTNVEDVPHAILVRALEPVEGIETMRKRRHSHTDRNLTNGPGKLCLAMGVNRSLDRSAYLENGYGWKNSRKCLRQRLRRARELESTMRRSGSKNPGGFGSKGTSG